MTKLTLDLDSLRVETFCTAPELGQQAEFILQEMISRRSCIEQCTTSCTP